jgi:hypothetical protein
MHVVEKDKIIKETVGIALFYTIITSIFALPSKLVILINNKGGVIQGITLFLARNGLWVIAVIAIIIILTVYTKKLKLELQSETLESRIIWLIVGVLVVLEGIINLASSLPTYIMSIQASLKSSQMLAGANMQIQSQSMIRATIAINIISSLIILCKIFFGLYLIKRNKEKLHSVF